MSPSDRPDPAANPAPTGEAADALLDDVDLGGLPTTFRGLDPDAVRALLEEASAELRATRARQQELLATIAELEARARPEELEASQREAARREGLSAAEAEAAEEIEDAKRRGRELVAEAQAVRRRVLEELVRRRQSMRRQIEQLRAGRERLLEAYAIVSHTVDEATRELRVALPEARAAADRAGRGNGPDDTVEDLEVEIETARLAGLPIVGHSSAPAENQPSEPAPLSRTDASGDMPPVETVVAPFEEVRVLGPAGREEPRGAGADEAEGELPTGSDEGASGGDVLDLFDRIRAGADESPGPDESSLAEEGEAVEDRGAVEDGEAVEEGEAAGGEEPVDDQDRGADLVDDLARRLRRELAEEQNRVLDRLRRSRRLPPVDDLLGDPSVRVARFSTAIDAPLQAAAEDAGSPLDDDGALATELATELADRLQTDLVTAFDVGDDREALAQQVRAVYRGWRTEDLVPLVAPLVQRAVSGLK